MNELPAFRLAFRTLCDAAGLPAGAVFFSVLLPETGVQVFALPVPVGLGSLFSELSVELRPFGAGCRVVWSYTHPTGGGNRIDIGSLTREGGAWAWRTDGHGASGLVPFTARFDSIVCPPAPRAVIGDDTIMCVYCEGDAVADTGGSDCPRCAGRGWAVRS